MTASTWRRAPSSRRRAAALASAPALRASRQRWHRGRRRTQHFPGWRSKATALCLEGRIATLAPIRPNPSIPISSRSSSSFVRGLTPDVRARGQACEGGACGVDCARGDRASRPLPRRKRKRATECGAEHGFVPSRRRVPMARSSNRADRRRDARRRWLRRARARPPRCASSSVTVRETRDRHRGSPTARYCGAHGDLPRERLCHDRPQRRLKLQLRLMRRCAAPISRHPDRQLDGDMSLPTADVALMRRRAALDEPNYFGEPSSAPMRAKPPGGRAPQARASPRRPHVRSSVQECGASVPLVRRSPIRERSGPRRPPLPAMRWQFRQPLS